MSPRTASQPADGSSALPVHWVDHQLRIDRIPGTFVRHGRYLYLRANRSDGVTADGHVVDGLQLIRTDSANPTLLEVGGLVLRGVARGGSVGVEVLSAAGATR